MADLYISNGQMLVELVLAIGLSAIILPALLIGLVASREGAPQQVQVQQATELFKETANAVREIRDNDWNSFAVNGTYHPVVSGNTWSFGAGSATVNGLTQQVIISDVYRDSSGAIVSSGGTLDPSSKKVEIIISWTTPHAASLDAVSYLTRTSNFTYTETLTTDFNNGTTSGTSVTDTSGTGIPNDGQVQLSAGGGPGGDWCKPSQDIQTTYDLPGQGVATAIAATSSATQNYAYATTGGNASGDALDGMVISHALPPVVTNPSSNNEAKAYGVFVDKLNNYVYFNENNSPNHTVRILHGTTLTSAGYFDASSNGTGSSIYVQTTTSVGFTTVGSKLYAFDVSTIKGTSSQSQMGSVDLNGNGKRVVVVGTNAYVVTDNTTNQLEVIPFTINSGTVTFGTIKNISLGNGQPGVDGFVTSSQTYAYVVTSYSSGKNDFFIVNLTNNAVYGYQTQTTMNPKGIAVVSGNRVIIVGSGGQQYQVFKIDDPSNASYCGGMNPSGVTTVYAVAPILQDDGIAFAYILTDNSSAEFQVVLGGSGGQFSSSGTFESQTFDPASVDGITTSRAYNRFVADIAEPAATTLKMQIAVAPAVSGSCTGASYTYVGPGGSTTDYFTPTGSTVTALVPLGDYGAYYQNPGRCFRYKLWFSSTDTTQTPILYDMTVNYSQ